MHELSNLSFWHDSIPADEWGPARPGLGGDLDVDVAIVGGGFTGLWTAYYLLEHQPTLRVAVLEAEVVGFGASGRNGGWCSGLLPMGLAEMEHRHSREGAVRLQTAMHETVDEIARVVSTERIDCHWAKGGTVSVARNQPQMARFRAQVEQLRSYGFGDADYRVLDAAEATERLAATHVVGGMFTPHCAAIHPARLARGLADVVERKGAAIFEHSPVVEITPHRARTHLATVKADVVVRATEAFTSQVQGHRRDVVPIYSLMVATEPLPSSFWQEVGLRERETFNDGRRMIIYGQRTADDRIAFGGRGAPYHFGSRMRPEFDRDDGVHASLRETLRELFPSIGNVAVTHRWGGAVAAARDWWCRVRFDPGTGLATAGAYVGDGVSTTNLAGRTLADLITGATTDLTDLPWVGHTSRRWEPEPLRWLGINAMVRMSPGIDAKEDRTGRPATWRGGFLEWLTGH